MVQKFYVDADGVFVGTYDGATPPAGAIEVPSLPPTVAHKWTAGSWVRTWTKPELRGLVNVLRDAACLLTSWTFGGTTYQVNSDPVARNNINGRMSAYLTGSFTADSVWTMNDDAAVTLTQAQFTAMALAVNTFVGTQFTRAATVKAAITAGTHTTPEAVDAAWAATA